MDTFIGSCLTKKKYYILIFLLSFTFIVINHLLVVPSSSETHIINSHSNDTYSKQELFNQRLSSYNLLYNDSLPVCNKTKFWLNYRNRAFHKMSELLQTFRKQIVPYPNDRFYGRGIVLTAGPNQIKFTKVNLKLIELTKTKLSVQVRFIYLVIFTRIKCFLSYSLDYFI
jgi:hypothetical protein